MENLNENTEVNKLPDDFINKYAEISKEDIMEKLYKAEHKIVETKRANKEVKQDLNSPLDVEALKRQVINDMKKETFYNGKEVSDQAQNQIEAMVSTGAFTREDAFNLVLSEENRKKENIAKTNAMSTPNPAGASEKTAYSRDELMGMPQSKRWEIMEKVSSWSVSLTD